MAAESENAHLAIQQNYHAAELRLLQVELKHQIVADIEIDGEVQVHQIHVPVTLLEVDALVMRARAGYSSEQVLDGPPVEDGREELIDMLDERKLLGAVAEHVLLVARMGEHVALFLAE